MKRRKRLTIFFSAVIFVIIFSSVYVSDNSESVNLAEDSATSDKEESVSGKANTGYTDSENKTISKKENGHQSDKPEISNDASYEVLQSSNDHSSSNTKTGHYETIPAYDENILIRDAYDEQILIKKGECHSVLVKDAYDEEVWDSGAWYGSDTAEVKVCNGCGEVFYGSISDHMSENPEHGGWHNEQVDQGDPYWHGTKSIIHHEAVYETVCEPDEYSVVHHEAEYKVVHHDEEKIWVES